MQIPGGGTVDRRRVSVGDAARQGDPAFEQEVRGGVSEEGLVEETSIRLGFCAGCELAFHNEAAVSAKCFFCPSVLCAICAGMRCQRCNRICCTCCVWRVGESAYCRRHFLSRAGGAAVAALPAAGVAALFMYLFVTSLGI